MNAKLQRMKIAKTIFRYLSVAILVFSAVTIYRKCIEFEKCTRAISEFLTNQPDNNILSGEQVAELKNRILNMDEFPDTRTLGSFAVIALLLATLGGVVGRRIDSDLNIGHSGNKSCQAEGLKEAEMGENESTSGVSP